MSADVIMGNDIVICRWHVPVNSAFMASRFTLRARHIGLGGTHIGLGASGIGLWGCRLNLKNIYTWLCRLLENIYIIREVVYFLVK